MFKLLGKKVKYYNWGCITPFAVEIVFTESVPRPIQSINLQFPLIAFHLMFVAPKI